MKKLLLILLCLPMIGFGQSIPDCDSSISININTQNSNEVVYSVFGVNLNMNSDFAWVYFDMVGNCIGGSAYFLSSDTVNLGSNLPDSTEIWCMITDSLGSCIVIDTLIFDSLSGWYMTSNPITQIYCSYLNVADIDIDSLNMTIDIAIYDGYGVVSPYPHVAYSIDAVGDTIHYGYMWLFGSVLDTTWYLYPINSFPTYPLDIYYVYGMNNDTCILSYNISQPTYFSDDYSDDYKEILKITDILGRESNAKNQPLFYIYDDGTVEKKIILE